MLIRRLLTLAVVVSFAGCSGGNTGRFLAAPPLAASRSAADTASALPGDTASALPGDTASALPGDTASALPGDTASALPGDTASALPGNSKAVCVPSSAPGQAACLAMQNLDIPVLADANASALTIKGYQPKDLRAAYHIADGGVGKTIAIVDAYDDPLVETDLAVYRATFGLPPCTTQNGCFSKVNQSGASAPYPAPDAAWGKEIALDVEMVSATCPACKILLVEANSASIDDLGASVDRAVRLGANAVSNSYAAQEYADEVNADAHFNHVGVPITVSSGDGGIGATYPAASRYVTAVGGTVMTGSNGSYTETSGWQKTGRGCSQYIPKPWWQSRFKCPGRAMTDVAALADPASGVAVYDRFAGDGQLGGWVVLGGTSVGAPIIAAAYAIAGDFAGRNSAARLYWRYKYLKDIPPVGWDYTTGLGTPNGVAAF